jgi:subtilisin family serine protease
MKRFLPLVLLTLAFVGFSFGQPIRNQYIVVLNDNVNAQEVSRSHSGAVKGFLKRALNGYVVEMTEQAAEGLRHNPNVKFVEQDQVIQPSEATSQWNLDRIDQRPLPLDGQYNYNHTGLGVSVYVIDSGINFSHVDFGGRAALGQDYVGDGQNGNDCYGHGSHVAGLVGGQTYGVAKQVNLYSMRIGACNGGAQISDMLFSYDWIIANAQRPAVINISYTAAGAVPSLNTVIDNAYNQGILTVTSAGNSAYDACFYSPAGVPNALTVSATWDDDSRWLSANYGSCVDLFAPGMNINSVGIGSTTAVRNWGGTSMAAPHVAGAAALYLQQRPLDSPSVVTQFLIDNSTPDVVTNPNGAPNKLLYAAFNVPAQVIPTCGRTTQRAYISSGQSHYIPNPFGASGANGLYTASITTGQGLNAIIHLQKQQGSGWNTIQSGTQIYSQQAKRGTYRYVVEALSGTAFYELCYHIP